MLSLYFRDDAPGYSSITLLQCCTDERFQVKLHHLLANNLVIIKELIMRRSLIKLLGLVKSVTKVAIFVVKIKWACKLNDENMGLCAQIMAC